MVIETQFTTERERERERESAGTGFLFEEPNPEREPPKRPNWALEDVDTGNPKGRGNKENPTGRKEQLGRGGVPTGAPLRRGQP